MRRRRWREADHPRDGRGRFTEDWVAKASERLGGRFDRPGRARGRDLFGELTEEDFDGLAAMSPSLFDVQTWTGPVGDRALGAIWRWQGFDGLPQVVSREEIDKAIAGGAMSLWRGVGGDDASGVSPQAVAEQYRSGRARPGFGGYGNGTYFAPDRAKDEVSKWYGEAVIHAALLPDARTISWRELWDLYRVDPRELGEERDWPSRPRVTADMGRMASLLGYDAILYMQGDLVGEVVVLNRTALLIEEAAR